MNWGIIFGRQVLERGRQYYNAGKVKELTYTGDCYAATVRGSIPYHVEIRISGKVIRSMSCTCPYAEDHRYCKHMAAVLTAIERRRAQAKLKEDPAQPSESSDELVNPFAEMVKEQPEYSYFDLARMTDGFSITKDVCWEAKRLVADGTAVLDQVIIGYVSDQQNAENRGRAEGHVLLNGRSWPVRISFDRENILEADCEASGCGRKYYGFSHYLRRYGESYQRNMCVHELALLYLLVDYLKEYSPGDTTDLGGARVLWQFRGKRGMGGALPVQEPAADLVLEPRLENTGERLRLSFRIGRDKLYVVKNLTELVEAVNGKRELSLGAKLKIDFAASCFAESSRADYDFIAQAVKEEKHRAESLSRYAARYNMPDLSVKGAIDLFGTKLDEAYTLLEGRTTEYIDSSRSRMAKEKSTLAVRDKAPEVRLRVEKDVDADGVFHGVQVKGQLSRLWEGARYYYYIEDGFLNRVSQERVEEFLPLYQAETENGVSFRIGRKNLSEFYYSLLPALRRYGTVEEADPEEVTTYLPPEASFCFYLDADEGNVTCQVRAVYGEQAVSVMDLAAKPYAPVRESYRDTSREREIIGQVRVFFPEISAEDDVFHCGWDEELVYDVLERGVDQLFTLGEVHSTDRFRHLHIRPRARVSVGVSLGSDIMNLEISSEDISREELLDILAGYEQKKRFYRLKNGDFLNMEDDGLETLRQLMEGLRLTPKEFVAGKIQLPVYRALYLDQMMGQSEGLYASRDRRFKKLVKEFKTVTDSDFEIPETLCKVMRKYQTTGYKWLRTLSAYGFGGILADDMGLGKTLQMISVLLAHKTEGGSGTALIVSPASLVFNWKEELRRFAPELSVGLIAGAQKERNEKLAHYEEYDVLVTSYDLLKRDILAYEDCRFTYQVLDEAQYIKNHSTAASKAVKIIRSQTRFALTGTPIENRLSELWSIFDYLMPGFLYGYDTFKKELETPIAKNHDEGATARLKRMVSPFILRRLKQEVLKDLPEKLEETRFARLEDKQQKLYDAQVVHMREVLNGQSDENFQKNKMKVLAELTKIRQICCDPSLFLQNYNGGSAKREACIDLIRSAIEGEHKILLFSQFTSMLELLEQDLNAEKIAYYKITGITPKERRVELVRQFNEDETPVFLISLKAGGTGLNLTGADVVIHYDPWWNLAVQNQATDRAHRIGQKKVVSVYRLIVKDSIEEKILHMQEAKKNLADEILSGETGGIAGLSREELLELIG